MDDLPDDIKYEIIKFMDGPQLLETYIYNPFLRRAIALDIIRVAKFKNFPRSRVKFVINKTSGWPKTSELEVLKGLYLNREKCHLSEVYPEPRYLLHNGNFELEIIKIISKYNKCKDLIRGDVVRVAWRKPQLYKTFIYNGFYFKLLDNDNNLPNEFRILENDVPFDYWNNEGFIPTIDMNNFQILKESYKSYFIKDDEKYYVEDWYQAWRIIKNNRYIFVNKLIT